MSYADFLAWFSSGELNQNGSVIIDKLYFIDKVSAYSFYIFKLGRGHRAPLTNLPPYAVN